MNHELGGWKSGLTHNVSCVGIDEKLCEEVALELSDRFGIGYAAVHELDEERWNLEIHGQEFLEISTQDVSERILGLRPGTTVIDFCANGLGSEAMRSTIDSSGLVVWIEGSRSPKKLPQTEQATVGGCDFRSRKILREYCREVSDLYVPQCVERDSLFTFLQRFQSLYRSDTTDNQGCPRRQWDLYE